MVEVSLILPLTIPNGDYLFYLEASPVLEIEKGVAPGPAAATKLYFSIKHGTVLGAIRARVVTFILTRPELNLILAALLIFQAFLLFRRHFRISVEEKESSKFKIISSK